MGELRAQNTTLDIKFLEIQPIKRRGAGRGE